MKRRTFIRYNKRLSHFTSWIAVLNQTIEDATTKELKYVLKYKNVLTQCNCAWYNFRGIKIIEPMILEELERRNFKSPTTQVQCLWRCAVISNTLNN